MVGPPLPPVLMGDIQPQRRQHVMDRLRRRIEHYKRQHDSCLPRHINNLNGGLLDQKQKTRDLQQRFLDSKAKKGGKKSSENKKEGSSHGVLGHQQQPNKFKRSADGNPSPLPKGCAGAAKELAGGLLLKTSSTPPAPGVVGPHGGRLMDMDESGGGGMKLSVEIVQQCGSHIQTNVTVTTVAGGGAGGGHHTIKTSDSPAPASSGKGDADGDGAAATSAAPPPLPPVMLECKQEPELDLESCCSGLDGSTANGGQGDAFCDSLPNLELMEDSIDDSSITDLIDTITNEDMMDMMSRFDEDDEDDTLSVATSNGDHKVVVGGGLPTPAFGNVVVPPLFDFPLKESSPAAQTLKQMAEQHQSKHIQSQHHHHLLQQQQHQHQQLHGHHQLSSLMGGGVSGNSYGTSGGSVDFGLGPTASSYPSTTSMQLDYLQAAAGGHQAFGKSQVGGSMFGPFGGGGGVHHNQMQGGSGGNAMHHHPAMMMMKQQQQQQQESTMFRPRLPGFGGLHGGSQQLQPSPHVAGAGLDGRKNQSSSPMSGAPSTAGSGPSGAGGGSPLSFGGTKPLSHYAADQQQQQAPSAAGRLGSGVQQMHPGLQQYLQLQHAAHQQLHSGVGGRGGVGGPPDQQQQQLHGSGSPAGGGVNQQSLANSQQQFVGMGGGAGAGNVRLHQQGLTNAQSAADGQSLQSSQNQQQQQQQLHLQGRDPIKLGGHPDPLMYAFPQQQQQQQQQGPPSAADQFRLNVNQSQSIPFGGQAPPRGGVSVGMPPTSAAQHMASNLLSQQQQQHHHHQQHQQQHHHAQLHPQHQMDRSKMQGGPTRQPLQPQFGLRPPPPDYASRVPVHPGVVAPQPRGGRPTMHQQQQQHHLSQGGPAARQPNSMVGSAAAQQQPPPNKMSATAPGHGGGVRLPLYAGGVGRPPSGMHSAEQLQQGRPNDVHNDWRLQHHSVNPHSGHPHPHQTQPDFTGWSSAPSLLGGRPGPAGAALTGRDYPMGGDGLHMMSMQQQQQQNQSSLQQQQQQHHQQQQQQLQQQQHLSRLHAARGSVPGSLPAYQLPTSSSSSSSSATSLSQSSLLSVATGPGHAHPLAAAFQSGTVEGGPSPGDFNDFFESGGFGSTDLLINTLDLDSAPGLNLM